LTKNTHFGYNMGMMSDKEPTMWYVYDKQSTRIQRTVKTAAAAKAWITRKHNQHLSGSMAHRFHGICNNGPLFQFGYADAGYFHQHIEKTETRRNLMTGQEFTQPVNTPRACDPSSELYWSM